MRDTYKLCTPLCALLLCAAAPALGQQSVMTLINPDADPRAVLGYWTPERLKAARPMPMPLATMDAAPSAGAPEPPGEVEFADGRPPSQRYRGKPQRLFSPAPAAIAEDTVATPGAVGTFGAHYTSTRVFPIFNGAAIRYSADWAYPHTTVGKLYFSVANQPYVCSAAVIQQRVVATAGHCVHNGNGKPTGFYGNWLFIPAYRDSIAPFGAWTWASVVVTPTWGKGGGRVPNAADYGMIEFADRSQGGPPLRLGTITGWLGWQTQSLAANHTSKLGYPCNLDACEKMQNVTSGSFRTASNNNVEYGSDAASGSSGGPWVQNFRVFQSGGGTGSNAVANRIVGITSYGYLSDAKVQGASILDRRWTDLLSTICARRAGNCN